MEDTNYKLIGSVVGFFILVAVVLIINPFTQVTSQQVGIITRFGAVQGTVGEGLHVINPFVTDVVKMDIAVQKETADSGAASKDLQSVTTQVSLNYKLDAGKVIDIYRAFQNDHINRVIQPAIQEAVKSATAKYTAEELITKREEVKGVMYQDLKTRLASNNIIATEVLITNFDFSPAFNEAVEAKVKAEQDALASKNKLEQTKYEAEQKIVSATADAEAIRIQAEAVNSQGGADYVQLQAIQKWNGQLPNQFVPGSAVPFLNLTN